MGVLLGLFGGLSQLYLAPLPFYHHLSHHDPNLVVEHRVLLGFSDRVRPASQEDVALPFALLLLALVALKQLEQFFGIRQLAGRRLRLLPPPRRPCRLLGSRFPHCQYSSLAVSTISLMSRRVFAFSRLDLAACSLANAS